MQQLLKLMPTDKERNDIAKEMAAKPNIPLRASEEFLHRLGSTPQLDARLKLLSFNYSMQEVVEVCVIDRHAWHICCML